MSFATKIECVTCKKEFELEAINYCPHCAIPGVVTTQNWTLEVEYDWEHVKTKITKDDLLNRDDLWRYLPLLPLNEPELERSLGEGMTPLAKCYNLEQTFGLANLYIKDETKNPTGSFKDRMIALSMHKARELGYKTLLIVSDGNLGSSGAAYCGKYGDMDCVIMTYPHITDAKLLQMLVYGGKVFNVEGELKQRVALFEELAEKEGWFIVNNDHIGNPYAVEGYKTIAYEVAEQMNWDVPDHIIVPTGSGEGLTGVYKGFKELKALGWIKRIPKVHTVQIEGNDPLVRSVRDNLDEVITLPEMADTIVGGINTDCTAQTALIAVRESGGTGVTVNDEESLRGEFLMARQEAVYTEPASGAAIAAVEKMLSSGEIDKTESVVVVVTSFGLKDIKATKEIVKEPPLIEGNLADFYKHLDHYKD